MTLTRDQVLEQIDDVLESVRGFSGSKLGGMSDGAAEVTRIGAAIERLAPLPSMYRSRANNVLRLGAYDKFKVAPLAQILQVLRDDVEKGYTRSVEELVHGEVFEDFLEMAAELHGSGYHAAAAVLAGSVLEDHLRKLAAKSDVSITGGSGKPRGVEALGQDLVKAQVFAEPQRKILAAWYGQRTEGAHGRPENVIPEEVGRMIPGVRDFIARYPA